jgi:hypothetical protein
MEDSRRDHPVCVVPSIGLVHEELTRSDPLTLNIMFNGFSFRITIQKRWVKPARRYYRRETLITPRGNEWERFMTSFD